ncbi:MAG TPA: putative 2OG-Fe(II) oxygenase [Thermohalobaculum sp.]|nr:putative 2OG-Fe(II) oxygenase [Xanthomonadales bacterium]HSF94751.1 putative 2OG-Fe(II) oxygenase [Thermohalobaculum sp.]
MTESVLDPSDDVTIGPRTLRVWPEGQQIQKWFNTKVLVTEFADHQHYAAELTNLILKRASDPELGQKYTPELGIGDAKVYDMHKWPGPEAALIHARAVAFFRRALGGRPAVVDLSWASVYRSGDYCMPHSHPRTMASMLYVLDLGDGTKRADGQFYFADPRMAPCCREEPGYMSTPCAPILRPGVMMMFPGQAVHFVTPYRGRRPRVTMTWNLNHEAKDGSPLPEGVQRPD